MNTTFLLTKDYEQITVNNEPIKTNPIKPNFKHALAKMRYHGWIISILLMKLKNQCNLYRKKTRSEKPYEKIMGKCSSV
jgi:hypothetical protein